MVAQLRILDRTTVPQATQGAVPMVGSSTGLRGDRARYISERIQRTHALGPTYHNSRITGKFERSPSQVKSCQV